MDKTKAGSVNAHSKLTLHWYIILHINFNIY